jgi:thiol:disulfide interchange protein
MFKSGRLMFLPLLLGLALASGCDSSDSVAPLAQPRPTDIAPQTVVRGKVEFIQGYSDGFQRAQEKNRPMLVFFTAQWCSFCHQMEAEAFTDAEVAQLAKQFVCILVDTDREPEVCEEFRVRHYPTIQFLSARGVPLNRLTRKQPAQQLVAQMQAALMATATRDIQTTLR